MPDISTKLFLLYSQHSEMNQVDGSFQVLWYISHYLIFLDCALTPVIYGVTNENYRRAFRQTRIYKICCFCKSSQSRPKIVEIFTFASRNYQLQSRNPIVTNRRFLTVEWLPEKLSKLSSKNQKKSASNQSQEKFNSNGNLI